MENCQGNWISWEANIEAWGVKGRMEILKFINVRFVMSDRVGILLRNKIEINLRGKG